jgi:hypothetical protein
MSDEYTEHLKWLTDRLKEHEALKELAGSILATLLLERNSKTVHPELLKCAEGWRKRYRKILGVEE